jgi:hypothetical protein
MAPTHRRLGASRKRDISPVVKVKQNAGRGVSKDVKVAAGAEGQRRQPEDKEHGPEGGTKAQRPAQIKLAKSYGTKLLPFAHQQVSDEEVAKDEEQIHPEKTAAKDRRTRVDAHHGQESQAAQAVHRSREAGRISPPTDAGRSCIPGWGKERFINVPAVMLSGRGP